MLMLLAILQYKMHQVNQLNQRRAFVFLDMDWSSEEHILIDHHTLLCIFTYTTVYFYIYYCVFLHDQP